MVSAGVALSPAPGRVARSAATIVFRPESGSTRTSGTCVAPDVGDQCGVVLVAALVHELLAVAVVEHRDRQAADPAEVLGDARVAVLEARVRDRPLAEP